MLSRTPPSSGHAAADSETGSRDDGGAPAAGPVEGEKSVQPSRQHNRVRTNLRAVLYAGTTFQTTVIRDISLGGAGLSGAHGLFPGEPVTITLLNGASRSGIVRWWLGGCCGVQFDKFLTTDDPFFETAMRRAGGARA
jgi:hypothetical protein